MDNSDAQPSLRSNNSAYAFVDPIKLVNDWYNDDIDVEDSGSKSELERYLNNSCELSSKTLNVQVVER